jgi:hypothetical protein
MYRARPPRPRRVARCALIGACEPHTDICTYSHTMAFARADVETYTLRRNDLDDVLMEFPVAAELVHRASRRVALSRSLLRYLCMLQGRAPRSVALRSHAKGFVTVTETLTMQQKVSELYELMVHRHSSHTQSRQSQWPPPLPLECAFSGHAVPTERVAWHCLVALPLYTEFPECPLTAWSRCALQVVNRNESAPAPAQQDAVQTLRRGSILSRQPLVDALTAASSSKAPVMERRASCSAFHRRPSLVSTMSLMVEDAKEDAKSFSLPPQRPPQAAGTAAAAAGTETARKVDALSLQLAQALALQKEMALAINSLSEQMRQMQK